MQSDSDMKSNTDIYMNFANRASKVVFGLLFIFLATKAHSQSLAVIANPEGTPSELSFSDLKSVFMGERQRWSSGKKVLIALLKTRNKIGVDVCDKVFNMKPDEMNKYWLALVFQGKASAPYFFNSTADLQDFVADNPGAIGIIDDSVTSADIKTILVDGKKVL